MQKLSTRHSTRNGLPDGAVKGIAPLPGSDFTETGKNVGRRLAIVLDGSVASAPTIQSQIGDQGVITGRFSVQEADELAKVLRAGALPATLKYMQQLSVGPSLGRDSIRAGVMAAGAGMLFFRKGG